MADSTINIKFDTGASSGGSESSTSNQFLISVLERLNRTLDKLSSLGGGVSAGINTNSSNNIGTIRSINDLNDARKRYQADNDQMINEFRSLGNKIGSVIGNSIMTGIGATAIRWANNASTAIVGRAAAQGTFSASAINGSANQAFGNYISNLYDIERIRRVNQNSLLYEGAAGTAGAVAGTLGGVGVGMLAGGVSGGRAGPVGAIAGALKGGMSGASKGTAFGGAAGYAAGTLAAAQSNANITERMMIQSALASRNAMASISQWSTGFSRFGMRMGNQTIVPGDITHGAPITVPLATDFQRRYGNSQNYNGILNGIVPNLNTNPLDRSKTGDLNIVAQNLLKAGFAAGDFAKITQQSAQYTAITGRNIQQYSEDIKVARAKFGEAFDATALQTTLNLMSIGYNKSQAQDIAYQAQYNPGMAGNISRFANMGYSEFYRNKAIGSMLGVDINKSLEGGSFVGRSNTLDKLKKELDAYNKGGEYGSTMMLLNQAGFTPASLRSLVQNKAAINENYAANGVSSEMSPAQQAAQELMTAINEGLKNVQSMNVTAQVVNINGQGGGIINQAGGFNFPNMIKTAGKMMSMAPIPFGTNYLPTSPN